MLIGYMLCSRHCTVQTHCPSVCYCGGSNTLANRGSFRCKLGAFYQRVTYRAGALIYNLWWGNKKCLEIEHMQLITYFTQFTNISAARITDFHVPFKTRCTFALLLQGPVLSLTMAAPMTGA